MLPTELWLVLGVAGSAWPWSVLVLAGRPRASGAFEGIRQRVAVSFFERSTGERFGRASSLVGKGYQFPDGSVNDWAEQSCELACAVGDNADCGTTGRFLAHTRFGHDMVRASDVTLEGAPRRTTDILMLATLVDS